MSRIHWFAAASLAGFLALAPAMHAQPRPYIGFAYPAGGQQGATVQIRLGGQGLDDLNEVLVTGSGVSAKVAEYYRRLGNQELQLLREQLKELKQATSSVASTMTPMAKSGTSTMSSEDSVMMMSAAAKEETPAEAGRNDTAQELIAGLEQRTREYVQTPACDSIASLVLVDILIAADAKPGERELRLVTPKGVSNPLPFHVGQLPEFTRKPMLTASKQVLGKEEQALRKRPADEVENRITLPCTVNGQIASGEVNRYRFEARKGQRLVISTLGRQLVPYIADAVPGWFQPVLSLYDAGGQEVAYDDDYRFKPDPTILYVVPKDGEYAFEIRDSIYRGREDFVYRITIGELPFVTSLFPLGRRVGEPVAVRMKGWNLDAARLTPPASDAGAGVQWLAANRKGFVSNRVPFALDTLPECLEKGRNNDLAHAQKVKLPITINGRVDKTDDWDVYEFSGKANDRIVAEVQARRLDSPLDSVIKLTDAKGTLLAFNDDHEDLCAGLNTHQADPYFIATLPADGSYFVHMGDTARQGGAEYAYRLRLSPPLPDFDLRVAPSSVSLRGKSSAALSVYALRKDGFDGPIKLTLKNPPPGFSASPITLTGTQTVARVNIKTTLTVTEEPVNLSIVGSARIGDEEIAHEAVPAEDRMQAFLWRHLVPASDLKAMVFNPSYQSPSKRPLPVRPPASVGATATAANIAKATPAPKFSKQQVAARLRQLKLLFNEGLLTDTFYSNKVAECETVQ